MTNKLPPTVQTVIDDYIGLVHSALPGLLDGLYIHGSIALHAFTPGLSDIDAITITSRRCTPGDIDALQVIHRTLAERYPKLPWEGSYLQWQDLGGFEATISPHPHIHDGIVHPSGYHDINAVTWWVLKHHGLAIVGPPPAQLDLEVDWNRLVADMHHNLNSYWARFTTDPRRIAWLLADDGIQWTVLGVLRQFYTFREQSITSKSEAGRYALKHVPAHWHRLIQEAINLRAGGHASLYRSRVARAVAAWSFLRMIIAACNAEASGNRKRDDQSSR